MSKNCFKLGSRMNKLLKTISHLSWKTLLSKNYIAKNSKRNQQFILANNPLSMSSSNAFMSISIICDFMCRQQFSAIKRFCESAHDLFLMLCWTRKRGCRCLSICCDAISSRNKKRCGFIANNRRCWHYCNRIRMGFG